MNEFNYEVNLVDLKIDNAPRGVIEKRINDVPYLLYKVETLANGEFVAINKPGGKRNFGRLSRNDFMVFIITNNCHTLNLISHKDFLEDFDKKFAVNEELTKTMLLELYNVCIGNQASDDVYDNSLFKILPGLSVEKILKVYKWIWAQEDCNYPKGDGRWLSMNSYIDKYNLNAKKY